MTTTIGNILLAQKEAGQECILRTGLMSQHVAIRTQRRDAGFVAQIDEAPPDPNHGHDSLIANTSIACRRISPARERDKH